MRKNFILLLLFFFSINTISIAQEDNILFYDISGKYGTLLHSPRSDGLIESDHSAGGILSVGIQTTGTAYWEKFFNYPMYGVRVSYTQYFDDIFGKGIGTYAFIQAPFFRVNKFSFEYSMGLGFGWQTKYYHPEKNPLNDYVSKHLNANIDLSLLLEYQISPHFNLFSGVNFSHFSNGATKMPNLGINCISVFGGIRYYEDKRRYYDFHKDVEKPYHLKNEIYAFISPSRMKYRKYEGQTFFGGTLELGYRRRFHPCLKWGAGIDIFYTGYEKLELDPEKRSDWNNLSQAIFGSFEFLFGDVSLHVALGVCTFYSIKPKGIIYERAGVYYNFGKKFEQFIGGSIKAYGGIADYIEWTYGFKIKSW